MQITLQLKREQGRPMKYLFEIQIYKGKEAADNSTESPIKYQLI